MGNSRLLIGFFRLQRGNRSFVGLRARHNAPLGQLRCGIRSFRHSPRGFPGTRIERRHHLHSRHRSLLHPDLFFRKGHGNSRLGRFVRKRVLVGRSGCGGTSLHPSSRRGFGDRKRFRGLRNHRVIFPVRSGRQRRKRELLLASARRSARWPGIAAGGKPDSRNAYRSNERNRHDTVGRPGRSGRFRRAGTHDRDRGPTSTSYFQPEPRLRNRGSQLQFHPDRHRRIGAIYLVHYWRSATGNFALHSRGPRIHRRNLQHRNDRGRGARGPG